MISVPFCIQFIEFIESRQFVVCFLHFILRIFLTFGISVKHDPVRNKQTRQYCNGCGSEAGGGEVSGKNQDHTNDDPGITDQ